MTIGGSASADSYSAWEAFVARAKGPAARRATIVLVQNP